MSGDTLEQFAATFHAVHGDEDAVAAELYRLRRRVRTLEARLAKVLRYAMNHRKGAFGETREWKQLPVPMRSEDRPLLVRRGRVWSRKRAR